MTARVAHAIRRSDTAIVSCAVTLAVLLPPLAVHAQEPSEKKAKEAAYAKTPDSVAPFSKFRDPYNRFFETVTPFRGAGREPASDRSPDAVRIGFFGPIGEAPDADVGQEMLNGATLAIERANAQGGYRGLPFTLVIRPDTGLWGASSNEMVAFKSEDDVLGVIGSIDGANTHIALRVALKLGMPMVNTGTTDPTLTETNIPWLLRCMADDRQQGYALAHHIYNECGIEKVAAFRANDRFGRTGIAEFRDAARRLGHPLRVELRWNPGDRDFDSQLDRIAGTGTKALVLWGNASDTAAVVARIRARELASAETRAPWRIFGCDRLVSRTFLAEAGEAAEGVVAVATYDPTQENPKYAEFVKTFRSRFDYEPEAFAAHAFDGTNIMIEAILHAGLNRTRIRDALFDYTNYDGVTGSIPFDATLNDIGPVFLATVTNGALIYRESILNKTADSGADPTPYRTVAQSPPAARSADSSSPNSVTSYRLGCFLPLDAEGQAVVRGVRMALADDTKRHPGFSEIELLVRDARDAWGGNTKELVDLVLSEKVVALVGSTQRRGTHLAEMLAAKFHFPIVSLCDTDPTVTQIPLPWVFSVAPAGTDVDLEFNTRYRQLYGVDAEASVALGFDAGALLAARIRSGANDRRTLRNVLASGEWYRGASGTFRFDALGNRLDKTTGQDGRGERRAAQALAAHE